MSNPDPINLPAVDYEPIGNATSTQQRHIVNVVLNRFPDRGDHMPLLQMLLTPPSSMLTGAEQGTAEVPSRPARETCGSVRGYRIHQNRHEPICQSCRDAMAQSRAQTRRKGP